MSNLTALPSMLPMEACIVKNDLFTGPFGTLLSTLTGALGALTLPLAIVMFVLVVLGATVTILSKKASGLIKAAAILIALPSLASLGILIMVSVEALLAAAC